MGCLFCWPWGQPSRGAVSCVLHVVVNSSEALHAPLMADTISTGPARASVRAPRGLRMEGTESWGCLVCLTLPRCCSPAEILPGSQGAARPSFPQV